MNAVTAGHDAAVPMIDTSIVGVYQDGACIAANSEQLMAWLRGGPTSKIDVVVHALLGPASVRFSAPLSVANAIIGSLDAIETIYAAGPATKNER
jgi:hypothetical protein